MAVAAGALTGCQSIADSASASGCDGTEGRVEKLESYGVLDSRPEGAVVPKGFEKLESGCWQDSGDAQLYASRTYVLRGDKAGVAAHYRTVAEREGWKPERPDQGRRTADSSPASASPGPKETGRPLWTSTP
ncbi:hypothetical protein ACRAR1_26230 [Streptomyces sanyensis]|uniref:hypothetical protein n=1 Tax=Streptomyces sanyensis TaxID=568869 RepID=UPI003D770580